MSGGPLSIPGAKATLFLSVTMTFLGITGVMVGYGQLTAVPTEPSATSEVPAEVNEAVQALERDVRASQLPKVLAIANLLVSALMVIASFLLTARRPSALWWTTQALWSNLLYSLAGAGAQVWLLLRYRPQLEELFVRIVEAQPQEPGAPPAAEVAATLPYMAGGLLAFVTLVLVGIYLMLIRTSRREDVRAFVSKQADGP